MLTDTTTAGFEMVRPATQPAASGTTLVYRMPPRTGLPAASAAMAWWESEDMKGSAASAPLVLRNWRRQRIGRVMNWVEAARGTGTGSTTGSDAQFGLLE